MKQLIINTKSNHELKLEAEYKVKLVEEILDADGYRINTGRYNKIETGFLKVFVDGQFFGSCFIPSDWELVDTTKFNKIFNDYPDGWKIRGMRVVFTDRNDADAYEKFIEEVIAEGMTEEVKAYDAEKKAKENAEQLAEANKVIAEAEKEIKNCGKLMTRKEVKAWQTNWNNINNEGGEGFIPYRVSKDEYEYALNVKAEIEKGN